MINEQKKASKNRNQMSKVHQIECVDCLNIWKVIWLFYKIKKSGVNINDYKGLLFISIILPSILYHAIMVGRMK